MTAQDGAGRRAMIQHAVARVYEDAGRLPPTVGGASRVIPLERLVAELGLIPRELPTLTRGSAASFLTNQLRQDVELSGPDAEPLSGYLYITLDDGEILVNRDEPIARRRFTVAHELGHYLLHAVPALEAGATVFSEVQPVSSRAETDAESGELGELGEVRVGDGGAISDADPHRWEIEANRFAAELLMPEALCRGLVEQHQRTFGDRRAVLAKRLASELLVSQQAMTYRLRTLGLGRE